MTSHFIINGKSISFAQPITLRIDVHEPYILKRDGEILTLLLEFDDPPAAMDTRSVGSPITASPSIPVPWTMGWKKFKHETVAKHLWLTYHSRDNKAPITREAWATYLNPEDRADIPYVLDKLVKRKLLGVRGKGKRAIYKIIQ